MNHATSWSSCQNKAWQYLFVNLYCLWFSLLQTDRNLEKINQQWRQQLLRKWNSFHRNDAKECPSHYYFGPNCSAISWWEEKRLGRCQLACIGSHATTFDGGGLDWCHTCTVKTLDTKTVSYHPNQNRHSPKKEQNVGLKVWVTGGHSGVAGR